MRLKNLVRCYERKVRKMLMVNRVDLALGAQTHQMREFNRDNASVVQQYLQSFDEIVQVGNVGQDVVANDEIGAHALSAQCPRGSLTEEVDTRRNSSVAGYQGHVSRRLYAQDGNPAVNEVLQQIPVITCDFDDFALGADPEALDHRANICLCVIEPRFAVRREVGIVAENILWTLPFLELNQKAFAANINPQRKLFLLPLEVLLLQISVRERRQAEIKENLTQLRATKPAATVSVLLAGSRRGAKRTNDGFMVQHYAPP